MTSPTTPFALYVHFPWCRHVCPYCDFNVYALARPPESAFGATLAVELDAWARQAPWAGRSVKSVFLGGGTPSLFSPETVGALLAAIDVSFGVGADAEVTLEANPGTIDQARLAAFRAAGVNRLSLGAESFHPALLRRLGRDHGPSDIAAAVDAARAAGIPNVSLDLIFAVPGGTLDDWRADLEAAIALAPDQISAYALTWEPGTPFQAWRQQGRIAPIAEDDEAAMTEWLTARLPAAGFERFEISSWARPGGAARHNQSYWDGSDYLGVGPGAHSFAATPAPGVRFVNERLPDAYRAAVERRGTAVASSETLTTAQARSDFLVTGLRRIVGCDTRAFADRFGLALDAAFPQAQEMIGRGLLARRDGHLRLTERGLLFADTVAAAFV